MSLSDQQLLHKLKLLKDLTLSYSLFLYEPYEKQFDFHAAGKVYDQRCLMAGNQLGKTYAAGFETAMHLTGLYPEWWVGKKFTKSTRGWAGSKNAEVARDGAQRILLGPTNAPGTGTIPRDRILEIRKARGVPDAVESVLVKNKNGDQSLLVFKGYLDGREAWQAETLDFVWFDEEPPEDIYSEGLTRTNNTQGIVYLTFTPLMGMTKVVLRFWNRDSGTKLIQMTIEDVGHLSREEKDKIVARYSPHERDARANGIPMLGEGAIFQTEEAFFLEDPLSDIPAHWKHIIGLDIGWTHPTAASKLVLDVDNDILHVTRVYRREAQTPMIHATAIKKWGEWIPVAWPKDGNQTEKGSGIQMAQLYRNEGLLMTEDFAQFPDKRGNGVEAGIIEMEQRLESGRLRVNRHCREWIDEYRMYHRVKGEIVKTNDDLLDSTRYGMVMLRYAVAGEEHAIMDRWRKKRQQQRQTGGYSWMAD